MGTGASSRPITSVSLALNTFPLVRSLPLLSLPLSLSLSRSLSLSLSLPPPANTAPALNTAPIPTLVAVAALALPTPLGPSPSGLRLPIGLVLLPKDPEPPLSNELLEDVRVMDRPRCSRSDRPCDTTCVWMAGGCGRASTGRPLDEVLGGESSSEEDEDEVTHAPGPEGDEAEALRLLPWLWL